MTTSLDVLIGSSNGPSNVSSELGLTPAHENSGANTESSPALFLVGAGEHPCLTFTTSGTIGGPKLVLHDQQAIVGHATDVARRIGLDAADAALLAAPPFCGTFSNAAAIAAIAGGAHVRARNLCSQPTISPSSSWQQFDFGCSLMSARPSSMTVLE